MIALKVHGMDDMLTFIKCIENQKLKKSQIFEDAEIEKLTAKIKEDPIYNDYWNKLTEKKKKLIEQTKKDVTQDLHSLEIQISDLVKKIKSYKEDEKEMKKNISETRNAIRSGRGGNYKNLESTGVGSVTGVGAGFIAGASLAGIGVGLLIGVIAFGIHRINSGYQFEGQRTHMLGDLKRDENNLKQTRLVLKDAEDKLQNLQSKMISLKRKMNE